MSAGDIASSEGQDRPGQAGQASNETVLSILRELVRLKDLKDRDGETADYRGNKDAAWDAARRVLRIGPGELPSS